MPSRTVAYMNEREIISSFITSAETAVAEVLQALASGEVYSVILIAARAPDK